MNCVTQSPPAYLPLFSEPQSCDLCFGIGLRISPSGRVEQCPALTLGQPHADLLPAAMMIQRAVTILRRRDSDLDSVHFDIARTLAKHSTDKPCSRYELIDRHFSYVPGREGQRRAVSNAIRYLRDICLLPVGSRKGDPSGYWIITDEADFRAWVDRVRSGPVTELTTIHRVAKANYPIFAEQLELDFWRDFAPADQTPPC